MLSVAELAVLARMTRLTLPLHLAVPVVAVMVRLRFRFLEPWPIQPVRETMADLTALALTPLVRAGAEALALRAQMQAARFRVLAVLEPLIRLLAALLRELVAEVVGLPIRVRLGVSAETAAAVTVAHQGTLALTERSTPGVVAVAEPGIKTVGTVARE
jgi:hypothetical protein